MKFVIIAWAVVTNPTLSVDPSYAVKDYPPHSDFKRSDDIKMNRNMSTPRLIIGFIDLAKVAINFFIASQSLKSLKILRTLNAFNMGIFDPLRLIIISI